MRDSSDPRRIEDYALLSDTQSAALLHRDGTIDWLCLPRFDSDACFAALLGDRACHGCWTLDVLGERRRTRRYRGPTMIVETTIEAADGSVRVIDFMSLEQGTPAVIRIIAGQAGRARVRTRLAPRFGYGRDQPAITLDAAGATFAAVAERLQLATTVPLIVDEGAAIADWSVAAGSVHAFVLSQPTPATSLHLDATATLIDCEQRWRRWTDACTHPGQPRELVQRSLLTLKALTFAPSGGMVAAPTTSLPEQCGGTRNWDYRFCWLRDATLTLMALLAAGHHEEARAWRGWLVRTVAHERGALQPVYGVDGERTIVEQTLEWLPGFTGAQPVRIGNAAAGQFQLDVFGEILDCLHQARRHGLVATDDAWRLQRQLIDAVCARWCEPDRGLWETRGAPRHFVHSKVMAWVAVDRAACAVEHNGLDGPLDEWRALRRRIHEEVCAQGFDRERGAFVQAYGGRRLDAAALMIPLVGFLPPDEPRVRSTVAALERELVRDGFLWRYESGDGVEEGDGAFLACSFWLADYYALAGRERQARAWFERACSAANDLGLMAETYDPREQRQWGNCPQAFSHLALVTTAANLTGLGAAHRRRG